MSAQTSSAAAAMPLASREISTASRLYKDKEDRTHVATIDARCFSWLHTTAGYAAFFSALLIGLRLHYHKIVENEFHGYPQEWFPSVSAAIGDRFPERAAFQLFICLASGPRFALIALWYLLAASPSASPYASGSLPKWVASIGVFRTLMLCGFTYITSTDNHDWHDVCMISYMVATIPWTLGSIALSPPNPRALRYRKYLAASFFGVIFPMIYFYIQHKVHRVPGAYTTYSFFEWSLIISDVGFDAITSLDFASLEITVRNKNGMSNGKLVSAAPNGRESSSQTAQAPISAKLPLCRALDSVADVYHGFIFWSMLTSLPVVIWYFPLWHMGISGYEALVMSTISPILLGIRPVRSLAVNHGRLLHLLSLAGVLAWQVKRPRYRLFTVAFGVGMANFSWAATVFSQSVHPARLESRVFSWIAGLILSSTVKFAWQTNNPIWPIMRAENGGQNIVGLLLGLVAAWRFTRLPPVNADTTARGKHAGSSITSALSVGALFFGFHCLLSDSSTMILWVWEGYPVRGPQAVTHGWLTVATMSAGLLTGISSPDLAQAWWFYGLGCLGTAILTTCHNWLGYAGAITFAFYLPAVGVHLLSLASKQSPAVTFGLGFLFYNFLVLFHVWVVAYAFVPGGPYVREHTDWVMLAMMVMIGAGTTNFARHQSSGSMDRAAAWPRPASWSRKQKSLPLLIINVLFLVATYFRLPPNDIQPHHADAKVITAGIWTIHFTLDNQLWSSDRRIRDLIGDLELDVVGLLESDNQRIIMGNRDTTQLLAEDLGMYVDYGPGPNKHTWGSALLSRFPIVNSTHHLLPSPKGELAPAIHATILAYGEHVDVYVFHSGQSEDVEDRRLQAEYMANLMGSSPRPSILLAYLVTRPMQGNYNTYVSSGSSTDNNSHLGTGSGMHDVNPFDWDRWCEYILYKRLKRVAYARVSRGTVTDTELQAAKFVVPTSTADWVDIGRLEREWAARLKRISERDVPEAYRFPSKFKGPGVRGHKYHVFREPLYYDVNLPPLPPLEDPGDDENGNKTAGAR